MIVCVGPLRLLADDDVGLASAEVVALRIASGSVQRMTMSHPAPNCCIETPSATQLWQPERPVEDVLSLILVTSTMRSQ